MVALTGRRELLSYCSAFMRIGAFIFVWKYFKDVTFSLICTIIEADVIMVTFGVTAMGW